MDNVKGSLAKEMPVSSGLPPPKLILNQSSEYEVIEKAAKLLKKVEQHWKKSLFQNRLQFSPISESLNSSESEHYIEKLAAIKFKDASFRNKQNLRAGEVQPTFKREASVEQNLLMRYDMVSNYFDLVGSQDVKTSNHPCSARMKEETCPVKCKRCLDKATAQSESQKKSMSVLPRQQYALKHNSYSRRGGIDRKSRGRYNLQVSPRSNESLPTSRTFASANSTPRNNTNLSVKSRMFSSNPDLRNVSSPHQKVAKCCHNYCSTDKLNKLSTNLNRSEGSYMHPDIVDMSNVSVVNIKSTNQDDLAIPEVNPRKAPSVPDKMIIIQHLPQVDIRPELSKQTGPVISIEAETADEEQKDLKSANIGVFNYIHENETKHSQKGLKPFSNYSRYRRLSGNNGFSEEESFAAQLELRSVAENFIYRLKKNDNPSGLVLMTTLLLLMDEINELIDVYMSDSTSTPKDPNLPPRMEMVSDLLSDELKTWGAQQPSHYQSLNNIIQHLILDIHYAKYGNFDLKELSNAVNQINTADSKKSSILKKKKCNLNFDQYGRHRHISLSGETNNRERSEATYRSTHSEEMSLSEKLLQENALKVQRLEKAYKINQRVRILQKNGEASNVEKTQLTNNVMESSKNYSGLDAVDDDDDDDKTEPSDDSKRPTSSNSSKSISSHPVVAIISPSHDDSFEGKEDDQSISEKVSEAEDGSVNEELQEDKEDNPEPIPEEEDTLSKPAEEPRSQEENHSDKHDSDIEEEVEEDISETSKPAADEPKDSPATDYDEDFEVDDTENQSQSVSVPTQNQNESSDQ